MNVVDERDLTLRPTSGATDSLAGNAGCHDSAAPSAVSLGIAHAIKGMPDVQALIPDVLLGLMVGRSDNARQILFHLTSALSIKLGSITYAVTHEPIWPVGEELTTRRRQVFDLIVVGLSKQGDRPHA